MLCALCERVFQSAYITDCVRVSAEIHVNPNHRMWKNKQLSDGQSLRSRVYINVPHVQLQQWRAIVSPSGLIFSHSVIFLFIFSPFQKSVTFCTTNMRMKEVKMKTAPDIEWSLLNYNQVLFEHASL